MHKYTVYLLLCSDNSLYCGITNALIKRLHNHTLGLASKYTRSRLPLKLVYYETGYDKSTALKREMEIKQLNKKQKNKLFEYRKEQVN